MKVHVDENPAAMGISAGQRAAELIRDAITATGKANIILATGASQFETLKELVRATSIEWDKVVMFHLDEYIGIPATHGASFRKYLQELFVDQLPPIKAAYFIDGDKEPVEECARLNKIIGAHPIDVALIGIGENSHLAFNDPPADFETEEPYIVIAELDEECRLQQLNEGWFASMEEIPVSAISMSVKQIMKSKHIVCSVPDQRKARAVKNCLEEEVSNIYPASILQTHADCDIYLDVLSASLLTKETA